MCINRKYTENTHANLDSDPSIELRGSASYWVLGFEIKHDSGDIRVWGVKEEIRSTAWAVLGGPVIGFHFQGSADSGADLTLIVGEKCRPKYFGARRLFLRLGEKREVKFYWQESDVEYFFACLSKGFFYVYDPEKHSWVNIFRKVSAVISTSMENIYSSNDYISITYRTYNKVLKFSIFILYSLPDPVFSPDQT